MNYADDFDEDARDGTPRMIPPNSTGHFANRCGFCRLMDWGFSVAGDNEVGSPEPAAVGVRRRPHLSRDLLASVQAGIRFPHCHRRTCVQVYFSQPPLPIPTNRMFDLD
jgi:hypothetical protein